jgi:uncharacterized cupredoxin-like copper-binding protein
MNLFKVSHASAPTLGIAAALLLLGTHAAGAGSVMQSDNMFMPGMSHASGMHGGSVMGKKLSFGEPGKPDRVDRALIVTMGDATFDPSSLQVGVGETIRFVVTNKSEIDHDFTIGDAKTQIAHRKEMAEAMEHSGTMDHSDDPNAVLVKPGETRELLWKFTRLGRFEFDCNIPGHYEAGMTGVIEVRRKASTS